MLGSVPGDAGVCPPFLVAMPGSVPHFWGSVPAFSSPLFGASGGVVRKLASSLQQLPHRAANDTAGDKNDERIEEETGHENDND